MDPETPPAIAEFLAVLEQHGPELVAAYERVASTATDYADALRRLADEAERVPWSAGAGASAMTSEAFARMARLTASGLDARATEARSQADQGAQVAGLLEQTLGRPPEGP